MPAAPLRPPCYDPTVSALVVPSNLLAAFDASLSAVERPVLDAACRWAQTQHTRLYADGGTVRDLLLQRPHLDVDLALDGDALALGACLAEAFNAEITVHQAFGTAVLEGDGWHVDVARTREERYSSPGALPEVSSAPIERDLARRDFTAHAIALPLTGASAGVLLDPFGGVADIAAGRLRVLHADSFADDPTRILRGVRYAARFNWLFEATTMALALRDGALLAAVSPARLGREIVRTLGEAEPESAFARLAEIPSACSALGLSLRGADDRMAATFRALRAKCGEHPSPAAYLAALQAVGALRATFTARLALTEGESGAIREVGDAVRLAVRAAEGDPGLPGFVDAADRLNAHAMAAGAAALTAHAVAGVAPHAADLAAARLQRYLQEWRGLRPRLNGNDLLALGVPPGPAVGRAIARLRAARIRGETQSIDDETALVRELVEQGKP